MKILRLIALAAVALGLLAPATLASDPANTQDVRREAELARIEELRLELARHDDLYFRHAKPEITDAEYDALKRELLGLLARHTEEQKGVVSGAAQVGDDRTGQFPTKGHVRRVLGLDKCYSEVELWRFLSRVTRAAAEGPVAYVVEPKYDGLAISLVYEHGELRRAVTRGNGLEGDVVTENLLACAAVPCRLPGAAGGIPSLVEIRGEVYVEHEEFARLNAERLAAGEQPHAHPRNLAAGTLKSLDGAALRARRLSLVCYGWGAWEPEETAPLNQRELLARLSAWGFAVPPVQVAHGPETVWQVVRAIGQGRDRFPGPLDGAVVKVDDAALRRRLGENDAAPRWAVAYKFEPERVTTRLRAIVWQVGRTGVLTPVAELDPVTIGGTRVARASLQNRREIERRDYRPGDFVRVEKAGEIIPQLIGVDLAARPTTSVRYDPPTVCPMCRAALVIEEVALRCPSRACPAQVKRRLEHFVGDAALDLRGFGPTVIAALVDRGGVRELPDLYRVTPQQWLVVASGRAKIAERLAAEVDRSRGAELWRVVHGLGLPGVGESGARRLAQQCGSLAGLRDASRESIVAAGWSASAAEELRAELSRAETRAVIEGLLAAGLSPVRN